MGYTQWERACLDPARHSTPVLTGKSRFLLCIPKALLQLFLVVVLLSVRVVHTHVRVFMYVEFEVGAGYLP